MQKIETLRQPLLGPSRFALVNLLVPSITACVAYQLVAYIVAGQLG